MGVAEEEEEEKEEEVSCSPHSVHRHVLTNVNSPSSLFGKLARLCMCVCVVCVCVCVYVCVCGWVGEEQQGVPTAGPQLGLTRIVPPVWILNGRSI